jgi:cytochrome b subunit of formate dehydrogenase
MDETVERYGRAARWLHAGVYVSTLLLLATGWWFVAGGYGRPSPLARLLGQPDEAVHELAGFALTGVLLVAVTIRARAAWAHARDSVRFRRGDGHWFVTWPRALFSGRFAEHDGHFDPGQRVANVVMALAIAVLVLSGLALLFVPFDGALALHRWSTFALTPVIAGHILIAAGLLPGYRGVWRSMHLGGKLPAEVSRRIWPGWTERVTRRFPSSG